MYADTPFSSGREAASDPLPLHPAEEARQASVREFEPFAYENDRTMRAIAVEAMEACDASAGMVSIMEADEERFLAAVGNSHRPGKRRESICAHTILEPDVLAVEDLSRDPRFRAMPYVAGPPFLRFYAGAPILDATGLPLGAVCVTHTVPHEISSKCLLAVKRLAEVASAVLESRLLFAHSRIRYAPNSEYLATQARMDDLLLTMVESRPSWV